MLPEPFVKGMEDLVQLPLLELAERIYDVFSLHRVTSQSAYVCKFFDILSDFAMDNSTGIEAFIDYWNQDAHKKTIQSDQVEGIRILTIHKSKGLEYDHVIIPYCSWKMEMDDTLWCHPQVEPFNQLPVALIDYSKRMRESIYASDYEEEHLQPNPYANLPKLNLLTYQMSDIVEQEARGGMEIDGEQTEFAFDLNEFFSIKHNGGFVHDADVDKFLDALTTQEKFPFSTPELRDELRHTFWMLNRVDSARALAKKLKAHPVFKDYEVVLAAGDGKIDADDENEKSLDKVRRAIKEV